MGKKKGRNAQLMTGEGNILGNPQISYYFVNKDLPKTFYFRNRSNEEDTMKYYNGEVRYYGEELKVEVSFICVGGMEEALEIFKCAKRITHKRVLQAHFYVYDPIIKEAIVCVDKFDGFLRDKRDLYREYIDNPIYGDEFLRCGVKEINDALVEMHKANVTSSNLDLDSGYFWCGRDKLVKIMCNQFSGFEDASLAPVNEVSVWDSIKLSHVDCFVKGLEKYIVKGSMVGNEEFVNFIKAPPVVDSNLLSLISTHPYLDKQGSDIMIRFSRIYKSIVNKEPITSRLKVAIDGGLFSDMEPWDIIGMRAGFGSVFWHPNGGGYNTNKFQELLRYLNNVYLHNADVGGNLNVISEEVLDKFSFLHFRLHKYLLMK